MIFHTISFLVSIYLKKNKMFKKITNLYFYLLIQFCFRNEDYKNNSNVSWHVSLMEILILFGICLADRKKKNTMYVNYYIALARDQGYFLYFHNSDLWQYKSILKSSLQCYRFSDFFLNTFFNIYYITLKIYLRTFLYINWFNNVNYLFLM